MALTREEFDNLKVGDTLIDENENTLLIEIKAPNSVVAICNDAEIITYLFNELNDNGYSLKKEPQYSGTAVKCESHEQIEWLCERLSGDRYIHYCQGNFEDNYNYIDLDNSTVLTEIQCKKNNYQIISFSEYCHQEGIEEPKWIQGFLVGDYSDKNVWVKVSDRSIEDAKNSDLAVRLLEVRNKEYLPNFISNSLGWWKYAVKLEL